MADNRHSKMYKWQLPLKRLKKSLLHIGVVVAVIVIVVAVYKVKIRSAQNHPAHASNFRHPEQKMLNKVKIISAQNQPNASNVHHPQQKMLNKVKIVSALNQPNVSHAPHPQQKMLIYVCTKAHSRCAGWSDRQRAITGLFLLANITQRRFGIRMTIPCDISQCYEPGAYDWVVKEQDLQGKTHRKIGPKLLFGNETVGFNDLYPEDVLFVQTGNDWSSAIVAHSRYTSSLPRWAKQTLGERFRDAWDTLMKPTARLQARLDQFFHSVNRTKPFLGVHVRMGRNPSNPRDGTVFNNITKLGPLWRRLRQYVQTGSHFFMATDSHQVRYLSRRLFGPAHHDTDGVIMHVGHSQRPGDACQGFEDALLDQLILAHCDVLFRSLGGFSLRASYMGKRNKKLFVIRPGRVTP